MQTPGWLKGVWGGTMGRGHCVPILPSKTIADNLKEDLGINYVLIPEFLPTSLRKLTKYILCGTWWVSGKFGALCPGGELQVRIPLWPPRRDLEQVLHSQLPVALWRVNSDTVLML